MSRWTEQFKNHAFHADWCRLSQDLETGLPDGGDAASVEEFGRLAKVAAFVRNVLDGLDPEIIHPNYLSGLHPALQSMMGEVKAYLSDKDIGHLRNANVHGDQLLAQAIQSPFAAMGVTKTGLTKVATRYGEAMATNSAAYLQTTKALLDEAQGAVASLKGEILNTKDSAAKFEARITAMETALVNQLSTFNTTFQASETSRAERHDAWAGKFQDKGETHFTDVMATNAAGLAAMQSFQDQAGKVLGTVVDTAQAGAYATYAGEEKRNANLYRYLALGSMATAAIVLFLPEIAHFARVASDYTVDWQAALSRLPFSLILFAPALYLAKESSRHRTNEVVNRRRQHILTTIGPYLALLDPVKAENIKVEVAKSIFSENLPVYDDKSPDAGNVAVQLTQLLATLKKS